MDDDDKNDDDIMVMDFKSIHGSKRTKNGYTEYEKGLTVYELKAIEGDGFVTGVAECK